MQMNAKWLFQKFIVLSTNKMRKKLTGYIIFIACLLNPHVLFKTIFFNFYHLPFRQAILLPIWLYKAKLYDSFKGKVVINSTHLHPGMIRLGFMGGHMYPNNGVQIWNKGKLVFHGKCVIGNNSAIITGSEGIIEFGDDFLASVSFRIMAYIGVQFGKHTRVGFDTMLMDTNFHPLYDMEKKHFKRAYGKVEIGDNNWFGTQCMIMPGVKTPERCIFGARSVITRGSQFESYCVHGGSPLRILSRNVMRIIGQDTIDKYTDI